MVPAHPRFGPFWGSRLEHAYPSVSRTGRQTREGPGFARDAEGGTPPGLTATIVSYNLRFVATYELVLEALGDKTRRKIVQILRTGPASVAELAAQLPVSRPAISQHLRVLRDSELVTFETLGTRNIYQLRSAGLDALRRWLDDFWGTVLGDFAAHVDGHTRQEPSKKAEEGQSHA
jgi:DNA-binding transcriptional ArsR family regulator